MNNPYSASPDSVVRANTSRKGYLFDYDPGQYHDRFSDKNMKAWGTLIYEPFSYYNDGLSFLFITSDKMGAERRFTIFSTSDGGYSLVKTAEANTKAQATKAVKEALEQANGSNVGLSYVRLVGTGDASRPQKEHPVDKARRERKEALYKTHRYGGADRAAAWRLMMQDMEEGTYDEHTLEWSNMLEKEGLLRGLSGSGLDPISFGDTVIYQNRSWMVTDKHGYPTKTVELRRSLIIDPRRRNLDQAETRRNVPVNELQDPATYNHEAAMAEDAEYVKEQRLAPKKAKW